MTQGAIQLQVVINNQSFSISKENLLSLKVTRKIGDSANEFTLEVFDDTAWQIENALMSKNGEASTELASISVMYSAYNDLSKAIRFSGTCLDYQMSFSGRAVLLTITGILASSIEELGWWFTSQAIEWVGDNNINKIQNLSDGIIDGKSYDSWSNYQTNRDVCAIIVDKGLGEEHNFVPYYNPSRIFERIIHTYNGDKLGTNETTTISGKLSDYVGDTGVTSSEASLTAWRFFRANGFTETSTAAILGNIQCESAFKNDDVSWDGGGYAMGLFQMRDMHYKNGRTDSKGYSKDPNDMNLTDRLKEMVQYALNRGKPWYDVTMQLEWALSNMASQFNAYTGHGIYTYSNGTHTWWPDKVTVDQFKQMNDLATTTEIFERVFERPSTPYREKRLASAKDFYKMYSGQDFDYYEAGYKILLPVNTKIYSTPSTSSASYTAPKGSEIEIIELVEKRTTSEGTKLGKYKVKYYKTGVLAKFDYTTPYYGYASFSANTYQSVGTTSYSLSLNNTTSNYYNNANYTLSSGTEVDNWGQGGTGNFKLGQVDESRWISGLVLTQEANQTAAQYITEVLCKSAMTNNNDSYEDEIAGFSYFVDANGHNFKALEYDKEATSNNTIVISYGQKNSNVISFSVTNVGSLSMVGINNANSNNLSTSSLDYFTGDLIRAGGDNILNANVSSDVVEENAEYTNWYSLQQKAKSVYVTSSSTESKLETKLSSTWNELSKLCMSAEITIWGDYSDKYKAGSFIDITVVGAGNKLHYASGIYYVVQIQDSISSSGFTQTLKLLKNSQNLSNSSSSTTAKIISEDEAKLTQSTPLQDFMNKTDWRNNDNGVTSYTPSNSSSSDKANTESSVVNKLIEDALIDSYVKRDGFNF